MTAVPRDTRVRQNCRDAAIDKTRVEEMADCAGFRPLKEGDGFRVDLPRHFMDREHRYLSTECLSWSAVMWNGGT
ncbi:hypothetical protein [Mesorhizobium sp. J428]|uniref:hypothetical protein n=1 Tax=Mesorhizobium sp. J428 TaxID=2898440 RepID=UPI0035ADACF7